MNESNKIFQNEQKRLMESNTYHYPTNQTEYTKSDTQFETTYKNYEPQDNIKKSSRKKKENEDKDKIISNNNLFQSNKKKEIFINYFTKDNKDILGLTEQNKIKKNSVFQKEKIKKLLEEPQFNIINYYIKDNEKQRDNIIKKGEILNNNENNKEYYNINIDKNIKTNLKRLQNEIFYRYNNNIDYNSDNRLLNVKKVKKHIKNEPPIEKNSNRIKKENSEEPQIINEIIINEKLPMDNLKYKKRKSEINKDITKINNESEVKNEDNNNDNKEEFKNSNKGINKIKEEKKK